MHSAKETPTIVLTLSQPSIVTTSRIISQLYIPVLHLATFSSFPFPFPFPLSVISSCPRKIERGKREEPIRANEWEERTLPARG